MKRRVIKVDEEIFESYDELLKFCQEHSVDGVFDESIKAFVKIDDSLYRIGLGNCSTQVIFWWDGGHCDILTPSMYKDVIVFH